MLHSTEPSAATLEELFGDYALQSPTSTATSISLHSPHEHQQLSAEDALSHTDSLDSNLDWLSAFSDSSVHSPPLSFAGQHPQSSHLFSPFSMPEAAIPVSTDTPFMLDQSALQSLLMNQLPQNVFGAPAPFTGFNLLEPQQQSSLFTDGSSPLAAPSAESVSTSPDASKSPVSVSKPKSERTRRSRLTPEERERKKQQRIERNRLAAQESRDKKKEYIANLEAENKSLSSQNLQLVEMFSTSHQENQNLLSVIEKLSQEVEILRSASARRVGSSEGSHVIRSVPTHHKSSPYTREKISDTVCAQQFVSSTAPAKPLKLKSDESWTDMFGSSQSDFSTNATFSTLVTSLSLLMLSPSEQYHRTFHHNSPSKSKETSWRAANCIDAPLSRPLLTSMTQPRALGSASLVKSMSGIGRAISRVVR